MRVLGVAAVGGSPSCGAGITLDLRAAFEIMAGCPIARIDRAIRAPPPVEEPRAGYPPRATEDC